MTTGFRPDRHRTDDFVLRSYYPGDGPALAAAANASYEHLKRFMAWAAPNVDERESERRARYFRARWLLEEDFVVGVFDLDDTRLLGGTGFHLREGGIESANAEIGMWIRAESAGSGLGTRVLVAMLEWGFAAWGFERLTWRCNDENAASQRVAEKAGMVKEAVLRSHRVESDGRRGDTLCYVALDGEWKPPTREPAQDEER